MLRVKIKDVNDQQLTSLLNEIGFVCDVNFMDQPSMALFDFLAYCFDKRGLKRNAKLLPCDGVLNRKLSEFNGTEIEALLRSLSILSGVLYEGYESRKVHIILSACAPQPARRIRAKSISSHDRSISVIRQRRSNGDL